jgi:hypothetical protein
MTQQFLAPRPRVFQRSMVLKLLSRVDILVLWRIMVTVTCLCAKEQGKVIGPVSRLATVANPLSLFFFFERSNPMPTQTIPRELQRILDGLDPQWWEDFRRYVTTGRASDEFSTYFKSSPECQTAAEDALVILFAPFAKALKEEKEGLEQREREVAKSQ